MICWLNEVRVPAYRCIIDPIMDPLVHPVKSSRSGDCFGRRPICFYIAGLVHLWHLQSHNSRRRTRRTTDAQALRWQKLGSVPGLPPEGRIICHKHEGVNLIFRLEVYVFRGTLQRESRKGESYESIRVYYVLRNSVYCGLQCEKYFPTHFR